MPCIPNLATVLLSRDADASLHVRSAVVVIDGKGYWGMNTRKLDHASFLVRDVERSRRFYTQVLGLRELARPSSADNIGAWFSNDEHSFEVHIIGEAETGRVAQMHPRYRRDEAARGHGTHVAFAVENVEATVRHLRDLNVEIIGGPRPRGDGVQQVFICDPDGYVIELFVREVR
jgi:catechol 2,3-dioxygenase-like lactoylglutathione lyase family enzyme